MCHVGAENENVCFNFEQLFYSWLEHCKTIFQSYIPTLIFDLNNILLQQVKVDMVRYYISFSESAAKGLGQWAR